MRTPLDNLFRHQGFDPALLPAPPFVVDEMGWFSKHLDEHLPPKRGLGGNLLIATWNIFHFKSLTKMWITPPQSDLSPKRDYRSLWVIAEIISRFDIVALQEVGGDLRALRYLIHILGPRWNFLVSDVSAGSHNNYERLAYLFDTSRVSLSGLAGEIVIPDHDHAKYGLSEDSFKKQFARSPYAVSFRSDLTTCILVTVHIDFGDVAKERLPEIRALARWLADWAGDVNTYHHNLITLGDFNLERSNSELYQAFEEHGLSVPYLLHAHPRTIYGHKSSAEKKSYHDQIAWFADDKDRKLVGIECVDGGIVDFVGRVLVELNLKKRSLAARISDHYPLWVEFRPKTN